MITNFNTSSAPTGAKGSNTLVYLIIGGVALYLGYTYLIKPELEKRKLEQQK